jgi:hypothetical protein
MRTVQLSSDFRGIPGDLDEPRFATQTKALCRCGKGECREEKVDTKRMLASGARSLLMTGLWSALARPGRLWTRR